MKQNKKSVGAVVHGEALIFQSNLPDDVVEIKPSNGSYHIIADSETTGNHHVIDYNEGTKFYQNKGGTMFMVNEKPTQVRCVDTKRHSPIPLKTGTWEFGIQQEYDHFAKNLQKVRD